LEEFYTEGLAPHSGPESCVDVPRGRGEALIGVRAGRAIEPRNQSDRGADVVEAAEGNTVGGVMRESSMGPARSENQGMYGNSMGENWESPCPPTRMITGWAAQGTRKAEA
jgi:RNA-directed DNA polymerase